jgi:hypothetical protein
VKLAKSGLKRVQVRVHKAGQHGPSMEVDHLRLGAASLENQAVRAQRQDRTALDRYRLLEREAAIDSHDLSVKKNEIGIRGMHARGTGEEKGRNSDSHPPAASYTADNMLWHR